CVPTRRYSDLDRPFHEVFYATGGEGVLDMGLLVAQDTGQQTGDRLDHDQGRRLPSVEDVVADTELLHRHVFYGFLRDPGVDALVASTAEDEVFFVGQPFRVGLPERAAAGCG